MKYFISDLDGTLLQDKHEIHRKDIQAVQSLSKLSIAFGIATGRDVGFCNTLMNTYSLTPNMMILNNGGSLYINQRKVMEMELQGQEIKDIMMFLKAYIGDLHPFVCDEDRTFYMIKNAYTTSEWKRIKQELSYLGSISNDDILDVGQQLSSPIIKLSIYVQDASQTSTWLKKLQERYSDAYEVLRTASDYIEFTKKGVHKGTALLAFEKYENIHAHDIIFIGDGENDITLMDAAGYSFAMDSANEEVKKHANKVVSSVREAIAILHSHYDSDND